MSKEYNHLNKEDIEGILDDLTNSRVDKERKMVIWVNEGNGLIPIEQSEIFHKALKEEVEKQWGDYEHETKTKGLSYKKRDN